MPKRALSLIQQLNDIEREFKVQLELEVTIWDSLLHQYFVNHGKRGRFRFEIGVQTFLTQTLEVIKRKQNNEMVEHVIKSLTKAGYVVHADLIGGLPFESYHHFKQSFMRLYKTQPSEIQLGILKILPGTALSKQAKALNINYQQSPPYTIIHNQWISKEEVDKLQHASLAVDKTYNRPLCKSLYYVMFKQNIDLFELLVAIGNDIETLHHPYQLSDVIDIVIHHASTVLSRDMVVAAIAFDVGKSNRFKPKILPYFDKKSIDLSPMITDIEERAALKKDQWFSNSWIYPVLVQDDIGFQWIVYPLHKRYYYTKDGEYLHEEDHFVSINEPRKNK
jgi:anaerobic magnesium-protoporphyrin IX monomethyl ester cyclase